MTDEQVVEQRIAAAFRLIATLVADRALIETLPDDVPTVEFIGIGAGHVVECAHLGSVCIELDGRQHG